MGETQTRQKAYLRALIYLLEVGGLEEIIWYFQETKDSLTINLDLCALKGCVLHCEVSRQRFLTLHMSTGFTMRGEITPI
jgi:hypothetical protein